MADKKIYDLADKNKSLAAEIDKLYNIWFDPGSHEIRKKEENLEQIEDSLDRLTVIVRQLKQVLANDKESRDAQDALSDLNDFISGDAGAALSLMKGRDRDDHVCKLVWLINLTTPVAVLSKELKESEKPLTKGPLGRRNITSQNVEQAVVAIPNSKQMKSPSKFLSEVLPDSFAAIAKHKAAAKAAGRRAAFSGTEYHNIATMDSLYGDIGSALVFVSTAMFAEANRAFTENGKRQSAEKLADMDFSKLTAQEQDVMMGTLTAGFRRYSNYTGELEMFSRLSEKMTLDAALRVYYEFLNDAQKKECGFTEDQLMTLPYANAFAKKYHNQFKASYDRYMNKFIDGVVEALKKEQETVQKDWFENKITGERVFRRGRLAGHGLKFMSTGPMKWLDEKLGEKKWGSLWLVPKLGMNVLKILTNPNVHKARKKLTSLIWGTLRSFAVGFKESFDKSGRSLEVSYDDVEKAIKEGIDELKKIKNDKKVITAESFSDVSFADMLNEEEQQPEETFEIEADEADRCIARYDSAIEALKNAISEESTKQDIDLANQTIEELQDSSDVVAKILTLNDNVKLEGIDQNLATEIRNKAASVNNLIAKFESVQEEREKIDQGNAKDKETSRQSIEVGEKTVAVCEKVFEVVNKYLARQWNLLALHSTHEDMPLCAKYKPIELDELVAGAAKKDGYKNSKSDRAEDLAKSEKIKRYSENVATDLHSWLSEKLNEFDLDDDIKARNRALGYTIDGNNPIQSHPKHRADDDYLQAGKSTAEYPVKVDGKYHYHGIALQQAENSESNGFGVFADRISKIAPLLTEFKTYVELMGDQSNAKTFDNSDKDENIDVTESYVNAAELLTDDKLNEDLFNKVFKKTDKAADKLGSLAAKPVKAAGNLAGYATGKLAHGLANAITGKKNIAKTVEDNLELTYTYSKSLRLSYLKDGVFIIGKHCLSSAVSKEFDNIKKLVDALSESRIPNSRSIESITNAVNSFATAVKGIQFKPCESIIDYELADKINTGALTDSTDSPDNGHIKDFYICNFEATRNIVRPITDEDRSKMAAQSERDKEAENDRALNAAITRSADEESQRVVSDMEAKEAEAKAAEEEEVKNKEKEDFMNQSVDTEKATNISMESPKHEPIDTNVKIPSHAGYSKANPPSKEELKSMNSKQRRALQKKGIIKKANLNGESVEHNFEKLAMMFEAANTIDWKEVL